MLFNMNIKACDPKLKWALKQKRFKTLFTNPFITEYDFHPLQVQQRQLFKRASPMSMYLTH